MDSNPKPKRKISAILAADVVGYSSHSERDEAGTFTRLRSLRKELFEPQIRDHHGRIFKLMGDCLLAEFASVVEAAQCAVVLQREMASRNERLPEDHRIHFRIGIHLGDIIVEGKDLLGDGVNIAARLQQLAEPGGIAVSGVVRENVGNRLTLAFEDRGEQRLKNIERPVRVYGVRL